MVKGEQQDINVIQCNKRIRAIHDVMEIIGGKWKVSIIACLQYQTMRYSDLLREVDGISGKMLSRELKDLEMNKLIMRRVVATQPISVEYSLTEYGHTLKSVIHVISDWGLTHRQKISEN